MECPYCSGEMKKGFVQGDRYSLKWREGECYGLFQGLKKGIKLSNVLEGNFVVSHYCEVCNKLIIDLNDNCNTGEG